MKRFIKFWSQIWTLPLGFFLFYLSPYIIHYFDETAETMTIGQLQKVIFVVAGILVIDGMGWLLISLNFPALYSKYKRRYNNQIGLDQLTAWEQRKYLLCLLAIYLFVGAILALAAAV